MEGKQLAYLINEFSEDFNLKCETIEIPTPNEGEVLVKLKYTSLNPIDYKIRKGSVKNLVPYIFPICLGRDFSGVIVKIGYGVSSFNIGDNVYCFGKRKVVSKFHGTYCQYLSIPTEFLALKPKCLNFEEAACVPLVSTTAYQLLFENAKITNGETVLIVGASGGTGSMVVQMAKIIQAKIIAVASQSQEEYVKKLGADYFIDYKKDIKEEVKKIIKDEGVDCIIDLYGHDSLINLKSLLKKNGRTAGIVDAVINDDSFPYKFTFALPNSSHLRIISKWFEEKKLSIHVSKSFKFDQLKEATKLLEDGHTRGKISIEIPE